MSGFLPGPASAGLPTAWAIVDLTGTLLFSENVDSVTLQFGGQYDFVFTSGTFATPAAVVAFATFDGSSGNTPLRASSGDTGAVTAGTRVYVFDTTGALAAATLLYMIAIGSS